MTEPHRESIHIAMSSDGDLRFISHVIITHLVIQVLLLICPVLVKNVIVNRMQIVKHPFLVLVHVFNQDSYYS